MIRPPVFSTSGIILKRWNWGEADKIVTVFTKEYGKLRILAKGVRKVSSRRGGYLEPFNHLRLTVRSGKKIDTLSEVISLGNNRNSKNLQTVGYAYFICEMVDRLTPAEEKLENIYHLLKNALYSVDQPHSTEQHDFHIDEFANQFLQQLGYLEPTRILKHESIIPYVENIIERSLTSPKIVSMLR